MRMRRWIPVILLCGVCPIAAFALGEAERNVVVRADGGAAGRMESIFVPPKANAPFSLRLATEWSRPLANGGTFTLVNERRIMRDASGRIYQERWMLVPKDGKMKSWMTMVQIADPEQHTWLSCTTKDKVCEILPYKLTTEDVYRPMTGDSGPLPNGNGFRRHDDLGVKDLDGVETHGYRDTATVNAGVMGNDKPMVTAREFWYSQELGINLLSVVDAPSSGRQVFTVTELSTSAPDPAFFAAPEGYRMVDRRVE